MKIFHNFTLKSIQRQWRLEFESTDGTFDILTRDKRNECNWILQEPIPVTAIIYAEAYIKGFADAKGRFMKGA